MFCLDASWFSGDLVWCWFPTESLKQNVQIQLYMAVSGPRNMRWGEHHSATNVEHFCDHMYMGWWSGFLTNKKDDQFFVVQAQLPMAQLDSDTVYQRIAPEPTSWALSTIRLPQILMPITISGLFCPCFWSIGYNLEFSTTSPLWLNWFSKVATEPRKTRLAVYCKEYFKGHKEIWRISFRRVPGTAVPFSAAGMCCPLDR